jgi:hypothetical protein
LKDWNDGLKNVEITLTKLDGSEFATGKYEFSIEGTNWRGGSKLELILEKWLPYRR